MKQTNEMAVTAYIASSCNKYSFNAINIHKMFMFIKEQIAYLKT